MDDTEFSTLGLGSPLVRAVAELGYVEPTAVQKQVIPAVLQRRDVWARAPTGSGKTAAFVLPLLERLSVDPRRTRAVRILVLVPTRELAVQIADTVQSCGALLPNKPKTCVVVGGVSQNPQMMALRGGADVVVASPGRLLDLVSQRALHLGAVETLVLDEADRLLALGFADELGRILALLPQRRQSLLFSATFPPPVKELANVLLQDPVRVDVNEPSTPSMSAIVQRAIDVDGSKRTLLLRHLIQTHAWPGVLVFVASRHGADHVATKLGRAGIKAAALHGDLSQTARTRSLADFKARRTQVLVATDVASRGLDIVQLPAVVNYDLPRSSVDFLHRVGRTGRAGESGLAITFITPEGDAHWRLIQRRHLIDVPREKIPGFEPTGVPIAPRDPAGGVKGKRKSKKDKLREAAALRNPRKS